MKSDKMPYVIFADIESLIKIKDGWASNPKLSLIIKLIEHIPCGYSMPKIWAFDHKENKHTLYHGKQCMKNFALFKKTSKKYNWFWNEKDVTVNNRRIKIASRCKSMLYLWKNNLKKAL